MTIEPPTVRRIAIVASDAFSLLRQRSDLIREIQARRHLILALIPDKAQSMLDLLAAAGLETATFPMPEDLPNMLADRRAITALTDALSAWRAHVVLACGAKCMLLTAVAAKRAAVDRRIGMFTGFPADLTASPDSGISWRWRRLMRAGFGALDAAVFHNLGHVGRLRAAGVLPPDLSVTVVAGAGVELGRYNRLPVPPTGDGAVNFLMIARKDRAKGVIEYCRAAKRVLRQAPGVRFVLAGPDGDLDSLVLAEFADVVRIVGDQDDVREFIAAAHVVVVPSWDEGMPRILLEALAAGRPVIASDLPGCREAIDERVNGVLVPPRDAKALAIAMMGFIERPDLNAAMGRASRSKAQRRFDVQDVNRKMLRVVGI